MWVNNLPKIATQWNSGATRESNRGRRVLIPSALTTKPMSHTKCNQQCKQGQNQPDAWIISLHNHHITFFSGSANSKLQVSLWLLCYVLVTLCKTTLSYGDDTQSRNLYKSTCARNLTVWHGFLYNIFLCTSLLHRIQHSSIPYKKLACTWLEWWALMSGTLNLTHSLTSQPVLLRFHTG